jgi:hypothetical protein
MTQPKKKEKGPARSGHGRGSRGRHGSAADAPGGGEEGERRQAGGPCAFLLSIQRSVRPDKMEMERLEGSAPRSSSLLFFGRPDIPESLVSLQKSPTRPPPPAPSPSCSFSGFDFAWHPHVNRRQRRVDGRVCVRQKIRGVILEPVHKLKVGTGGSYWSQYISSKSRQGGHIGAST